jgi:hypothetical protein
MANASFRLAFHIARKIARTPSPSDSNRLPYSRQAEIPASIISGVTSISSGFFSVRPSVRFYSIGRSAGR